MFNFFDTFGNTDFYFVLYEMSIVKAEFGIFLL